MIVGRTNLQSKIKQNRSPHRVTFVNSICPLLLNQMKRKMAWHNSSRRIGSQKMCHNIIFVVPISQTTLNISPWHLPRTTIFHNEQSLKITSKCTSAWYWLIYQHVHLISICWQSSTVFGYMLSISPKHTCYHHFQFYHCTLLKVWTTRTKIKTWLRRWMRGTKWRWTK
jgi:hypothetical protein